MFPEKYSNDHFIRNRRSLNAIKEYIQNNPINWEYDIENLINCDFEIKRLSKASATTLTY